MSHSGPPSDDKNKGQDEEPDLFATASGDADMQIGLLTSLLEAKVISPAQGQLLLADQEVTGMTLEEVILARGWITEAKLDEIAPWRKKQVEQKDSIRVTAGSKNYQQNFKQYRLLMEKILGMSWD